MGVTLQVIGANAHKLGGRTEQEFLASGTIGRVDGNTMVLPDTERFISSHHAAIEDRGDGFYLVDTSINGTFVNGADQPIGHGNAYRLEDGDRIKIGEFELLAVVQEVQSQSSQWPQTSQSSQWPPPADPWQGSDATPTPGVDPLSNQSVDPLQLIPGQSSPLSQIPEPAPQPMTDQPALGMGNFTPPRTAADPFAPSSPNPFDAPSGQPDPFAAPAQTPPPGQGSSVIPEDWDKTSMPSAGRKAAPMPPPADSISAWNDPVQNPPPVPQNPAGQQNYPPQQQNAPGYQNPAASQQPQGYQNSPGYQNPAQAEVADPFGTPPVPPQAGGFQPAAMPPPGPAAAPRSDPGAVNPAHQIPGQGPGTVAPGQRPTPGGNLSPGTAAGASQGGIAAMLEAAGLDPATARSLDNPATGQAIGLVLRMAVRELMEVLRARAEVKNQFRVPMTQISATENNPLKFCADELDALTRLLVQDGHGFKGAVEAVGEGFEDVKSHQIAMMAGMRAAFDHLLARFDPDQLRQGFDQELRRSKVFQPLNKTKYWDMLEELYKDISRDSDANFARLFGDEFARAYEEQMDQLSRHRR